MKPNGRRWRLARAQLDLSILEAAAPLKITDGYLRNIETNQPRALVSERLVYRAVRLYGVPFEELVDDGEDSPSGSPKQPKKHSASRKGTAKGSKRTAGRGAAA